MKRNLRREKGITIIALVTTIILMLILTRSGNKNHNERRTI